MPLSHLIALMIHTRSFKPAHIVSNHTRHQAGACSPPYGLLGSRPHDQNFKDHGCGCITTSAPHASTRPVHPAKCHNSTRKDAGRPPQRPPGTRHHPLHNVKQSQTSNAAIARRPQTKNKGNLLLFNEHFFEQPQSPAGASAPLAFPRMGAGGQSALRRLRAGASNHEWLR